MRSAWAERSPSAALEPRRGCPKISPLPPRAIAAMFVGEICDSIRGKIDCRQKIKPKSDRLLGTSDLTRPWQSYRQSFRADPQWRTAYFRFEEFVPYRTDVPLNTQRLRRIGVVAIGRAFSADLAVGGVRLMN